MKALRFEKTGDLNNLALVECARPHAPAGGVLVQVRAARLNKSDASNVLGRHGHTTLPRIPGRDFSGVVIEGPPSLAGREVWGTSGALGFTRDGSHAEFLAAGADEVALKPASLSFVQAACCGVPYTTATSALERTAASRDTQVLVIGAAGAVGGAAAALARARGARVLGGVRRAEQAAALAAQGIAAIELGAKPLAAAVAEHFPGGAEVIVDATGHWLPEAVGALARYGRIAVMVAPGEGRVEVPIRDLYRRAGSIVGINSMLFSAADCARMLAGIGAAFDRGELPAPAPAHERRLEDYAQAYDEVGRAAGAGYVFVMP